MEGRNLYDEILILQARENHFEPDRMQGLISRSSLPDDPSLRLNLSLSPVCVFLSHRSVDKPFVSALAARLAASGIDYYLDSEDPILQQADLNQDHDAVTFSIELGISRSTHVLSILSSRTQGSWWVPYEIGYGKAKSKDLAALKLRDLSQLPSYLRIKAVRQLNASGPFESYVSSLSSNVRTALASIGRPLFTSGVNPTVSATIDAHLGNTV